MAGMTDIDDDERWARAESILAEHPTPSAQQQIRRNRALLWLLVVAVAVLGVGIGVLVGLAAHPARHPRQDVASWQLVVGFGLQAVALVVVVSGFLLQRRANGGRMPWRWNVPTSVLSRTQRRGLVKQMRGKQPVDPRRLGLLRDLAARVAHQRSILMLLIGLAILYVGQTIVRPTWWQIAICAAYLVLVAVATVVQTRLGRQARRFLDEHPAAESQPVD